MAFVEHLFTQGDINRASEAMITFYAERGETLTPHQAELAVRAMDYSLECMITRSPLSDTVSQLF